MEIKKIILIFLAIGFITLLLVNEFTMDREELTKGSISSATAGCTSEAPPFDVMFRLVIFPLIGIVGVTICVMIHVVYERG